MKAFFQLMMMCFITIDHESKIRKLRRMARQMVVAFGYVARPHGINLSFFQTHQMLSASLSTSWECGHAIEQTRHVIWIMAQIISNLFYLNGVRSL
jgi:hypothetical protein